LEHPFIGESDKSSSCSQRSDTPGFTIFEKFESPGAGNLKKNKTLGCTRFSNMFYGKDAQYTNCPLAIALLLCKDDVHDIGYKQQQLNRHQVKHNHWSLFSDDFLHKHHEGNFVGAYSRSL
jgi:hypothetical protein